MTDATTTIEIVSEAQWLAERAKDVTSTEVAALYGLSPYVTEFELWHRKRDGVAVSIEDSERMKWGRRLESAIATGIAEDHGWQARKRNVYGRIDECRLGASFDFEVVDAARGPGLLEIKNVDRMVFLDQWHEGADGVIEAPPHIEIQLQTQLEVAGYGWGCIVPLVGGNEAHTLMRDRDRDIGDDVRRRTAAFWRSVEAGTPPRPDFERDAGFIIDALRRHANAGETVDADTALEALLQEYADAAREAADAERRKNAAKAEALMLVGTASRVRSQIGAVSCGEVQDSAGTLITPDMVGTYVGARRGFRQFRFTPRKETP